MARSLNKVMIIGNLGSDPEVRSTNGGKQVAQFNVATSRSWNNAQGEKQEKTEWHRMILWEGLAGVAERFLKKGDRCYFEGEIEYRSYEDKEKVTKYVTEIRVRDMIMLSGPREGQQFTERSSGGRGNSGGERQQAQQSAPQAGGEDDDLPF